VVRWRLFFSRHLGFFFNGIDAGMLLIGESAVSCKVACFAATETSSILSEALPFGISEFANGINVHGHKSLGFLSVGVVFRVVGSWLQLELDGVSSVSKTLGDKECD
jgi:hypothetical protein